jgi:hypothetical protein
LFWRSGRLPLRTAGAGRLRFWLNQSESEVVVLGRFVGQIARRGVPDRFLFLWLGSRRFCGGGNGFRLDVQAVEVERIVVNGGGVESAGAAEEVVG